MRGVNLGGWFSQVDAIREKDPDAVVDLKTHVETFLTPPDFARIRAFGFDHVRLPVDYFNLFDGTDLRPVETILGLLDRAIDAITGQGLDVVLDLHKCPGHDFHAGCRHAQEFFTNPEMRSQTFGVWRHLAQRYAHHRRILFELLNEPVAEDSKTWDEVKNELVTELRRFAPNTTLVIGSNRWNSPGEFAHLTPVADANAIYSFHFYSPLLFTHQRAPWLDDEVFKAQREYPGNYSIAPGTQHRLPLEVGRWDRERMREALEPVLQFRTRYRVPVACNEFGVYVGGADRESQLRWMRDFISVLDEAGIGFSYWNYKNLDFGLVSVNERAFANYPQYQSSERLDRELVEVLGGDDFGTRTRQ